MGAEESAPNFGRARFGELLEGIAEPAAYRAAWNSGGDENQSSDFGAVQVLARQRPAEGVSPNIEPLQDGVDSRNSGTKRYRLTAI